jgi:TonB family protein
MVRVIFISALLIGTAASALAAPSPRAETRNASNFDVILSQYPARARAAGEQGAVGFKVALDRNGYATACEVTHSSGYPRLDEETCQLILSRATFRGTRKPGGSVHQGVVNWRLDNAAGQAPLVAVAAAGKDVPEKKICRRRPKTGSLADFERICATKADWDRMAQRTREEWGALQGGLGSTHSVEPPQ